MSILWRESKTAESFHFDDMWFLVAPLPPSAAQNKPPWIFACCRKPAGLLLQVKQPPSSSVSGKIAFQVACVLGLAFLNVSFLANGLPGCLSGQITSKRVCSGNITFQVACFHGLTSLIVSSCASNLPGCLFLTTGIQVGLSLGG